MRTLLLALVLLLAGCSSPGAAPKRYPDSMAAIGDSITAAANVARDRVGENPADSWSVGDAPDDGVTSHYERLVALNPTIQGHATDLAVSGARMEDFARQAREAVDFKAEYVTVMLGANDVCGRSGNLTPVETFRAQFRDGAAVLKALPRPSWVLVVGVPNVTALWDRHHEDRQVHDVWQAFGLCPAVLSDRVNDTGRALARERIDAYNDVLREESAAAGFAYDDGAVHDGRMEDAALGPVDYFHPSLAGQAAIAEATWKAGPFGGGA